MKKIITPEIKQQQLRDKAKKLIICNAGRKSYHCLKACRHGVPHEKEREKGVCHTSKETCTLSKSGIIRIICKPLTVLQRNKWVEKESKNES